ncbi:hypothetical protein DFH27DRAFT_527564 [Peziza echinospora]|nr:hypothetical protein DFH27DRAFT_527564 [Peziza echinospora]
MLLALNGGFDGLPKPTVAAPKLDAAAAKFEARIHRSLRTQRFGARIHGSLRTQRFGARIHGSMRTQIFGARIHGSLRTQSTARIYGTLCTQRFGARILARERLGARIPSLTGRTHAKYMWGPDPCTGGWLRMQISGARILTQQKIRGPGFSHKWGPDPLTHRSLRTQRYGARILRVGPVSPHSREAASPRTGGNSQARDWLRACSRTGGCESMHGKPQVHPKLEAQIYAGPDHARTAGRVRRIWVPKPTLEQDSGPETNSRARLLPHHVSRARKPLHAKTWGPPRASP